MRWLMMVAVAGALCAAAPPAHAAPADEAANRVSELESSLERLRKSKSALARTHRQQTAEVAGLKAQRSSWTRDRKLRASLARARATANRLAALDRSLRDQATQLERARELLIRAVDAELAAPATEKRRAQLAGWKRRAEAALRPAARRIVLPDQRIDPLADATELGAQARLIAETEARLQREEDLLVRREERYRRIARLQRQRRRASEADLFDDDRTRRTTGRVGTATADPDRSGGDGAADAPTGEGSPPSPTPPADPSSGEDDAPAPDTPPNVPPDDSASSPTIVLADVVDADTISALRRAERSNDPAVKAAAAARARAQVAERRRRLGEVRERIRRRINEMSR